MKLAEMTWPEVGALSRDTVVVIPTGSLEQHGPHLPLFTDSILATAVSEAVERQIGDKVLLTPTLWLGASGHHLPFPGSLSNSMEGYDEALRAVVTSLHRHGFWKFYVVNGHGGNTSPNDIALRKLKETHPNLLIGAVGYFQFCTEECAALMEGPAKSIQHACEAEASLMMHVRPELVRVGKLRDDGLAAQVPGMVHLFDEITEEGSKGYATLANADKGAKLFDAAVNGLCEALGTLYSGYRLG